MKKIINSILENQGLSLTKLSKITKISSETLSNSRREMTTNHFKKINLLHQLKTTKIGKNNLKIILINNKEYIETKSLFPEKTRTGLNLHYVEKNKKIRVWYQPKTRGKIELILPKYIKLDKRFVCSLGLSIGDGLNNPSLKNTHYDFANTNLELIKYNYSWLIKYFKLKKENIQVFALAPTKSKDFEEKEKISKLLKIKREKIKIYKSDRNNKLDVIIQIGNSIFQCLYLQLFKRLNTYILKDKVYRREFIKGLFAAEGHIKHSVYNTIESIVFAFNPKTEIKIAKFIKAILRKEKIKSKIKPTGYVYLCNYENMIKFYSLGLIELYKDKKNKFIRLCKNAKIYLHFKKSYVTSRWKESQYTLAKKWGLCQPTICAYKNKNCMNFYLAKKLLSKKEIIRNTKYIKITNSKIRNKKSIKFVINNLYKTN